MSGDGAAQYANSAVLRVDPGPLAGPATSRVVSMLAPRAGVPIDRLDDALIVCDALITHARGNLLDEHLDIRVEIDRRCLRLLVCGLQSGGGERLIASTTLPESGNLLERRSEELEVQPGSAGEKLALRIPLQA